MPSQPSPGSHPALSRPLRPVAAQPPLAACCTAHSYNSCTPLLQRRTAHRTCVPPSRPHALPRCPKTPRPRKPFEMLFGFCRTRRACKRGEHARRTPEKRSRSLPQQNAHQSHKSGHKSRLHYARKLMYFFFLAESLRLNDFLLRFTRAGSSTS